MNCSSLTSVMGQSLSMPIFSTAKIAAPISVIPAYRTISGAVHLTVATVMKHIAKLADRQFITIQNTSYIDGRGMKWNGNNQYTILPIQAAMDHCYQQKMIRLEEQQKWQQTQALLVQNTEDAPCAPL